MIYALSVKRKKWLEIVKKLDFTLLLAKYYLYINKLAPKDLSLDEFRARISWRYWELWGKSEAQINLQRELVAYQHALIKSDYSTFW